MIVVTGMHRSGTSCVAELLAELGLPLSVGSGLLEADRWNVRGYFEERAVLELNSRLVTGRAWRPSGPGRWLGLIAYLSMPAPETIAKRAEANRDEIEALAAARRGLMVKDPRFCVTLPAWERFGSVSACVVCLRDPREVAISLHRRQRIPITWALRFWQYHAASLLRSIPDRTLVLDYNALLGVRAKGELERIADFFELAPEVDLEAAYLRVCSASLLHARANAEPLPLAVQSTWDAWLRARDASGTPISSETK